jgi:hypothetical protein
MLSTTFSGMQATTTLVKTVGAFLAEVLSFDAMMVCEVARAFIRWQFWGKVVPEIGKVVSGRRTQVDVMSAIHVICVSSALLNQ